MEMRTDLWPVYFLGAVALGLFGGVFMFAATTPGCLNEHGKCVSVFRDNKPMAPKRVPVIRMVGQQDKMSPQERIDNAFYGVEPPEPAKPENIWAYARRTDG